MRQSWFQVSEKCFQKVGFPSTRVESDEVTIIDVTTDCVPVQQLVDLSEPMNIDSDKTITFFNEIVKTSHTERCK